MSEMIERVAKAIMQSHQEDRSLGPDEHEGVPCYYSRMAHAAIEAMREPTEAMADAGLGSMDWDDDLGERGKANNRSIACHVFVSMIDAALTGGK